MKQDDLFCCINRRLSSGEVTYLIKNAKAIVCPYLTMSQSGIPQTVMAYNKPIIATNLPAFKEVLTDEVDSLLFEVGDSSALYKKIQRIYEERKLYNDLVDNIRNFEKNNPEYSWNRICQRYIELIE